MKTEQRYREELSRVRELNYNEKMTENNPGVPVESSSSGSPNRYRMPSPRNIPPSPSLGR
ncbi:MAG: hypothetical protein NTZ20_04675 [Candidatus Levybacteria bacterium]|nr:hypothetical protein [Candidatus Levybacteria bacterium]